MPLVRTDDNPADFFTKPVSSDKFFKFRGVIMNIANDSNLSAAAATFTPPAATNFEDPPPRHVGPKLSSPTISARLAVS